MSALLRGKEFLENNPILQLDQLLSHSLSDSNKTDPIWEFFPAEKSESVCFPAEFIHLLIYVRNLNKLLFNSLEGEELCTIKSWDARKHNPTRNLDGGGVMSIIRANHLEKSAVNLSCVWGENYPSTESEYANKPFAAAGVSLISHPRNPFAPIMHMNIRCLKVFDKDNPVTWIGGGADLTPMLPFDDDTNLFHSAMSDVCERNKQIADYPKFKNWAKDYFYIPHRKEERGVGGIFFDYLKIKNNMDFSLLLDVGQFAARAYAEILGRRLDTPYDQELIEKHHFWRGRYAEFNLVYDRGTKFGLMSGGNYEAIFCSLPPQVKW
ncbi:coproporphyrinogen III oxidase [Pigmentibacter ruber]|uniref:coproporphyrinogen III oxidase n=1 Tax=Pigmentibacter ruber TaxID=2683196 RepID=UPI00131AEB45|nr:coproporphyrinogen III oxidase [Pigmentibacter ruber]BFD32842.1 hypothetical protein GTC16762_24600 [Pigmentibacter ruber]